VSTAADNIGVHVIPLLLMLVLRFPVKGLLALCDLQLALFLQSERCHSFERVLNSLPAVQADLIGIVFQRERP
jgi:hypothetical protein